MREWASWPYLALLVGCTLAAGGQLLLKLGSKDAVGLIDFFNFRLASGLMLYGLGTGLWILALSKVPLNIAYAFTALTFVMVYLGSVVILHERLGLLSFVGISLILGGFVLIAYAGVNLE